MTSQIFTRSCIDPTGNTDVGSFLVSYRATLQSRCQRAYGWDSILANRVFVSYSQFLDLKVILNDVNAEYLSPSFLVDQMWHQHLLDNRHYEQFCQHVCRDGRQIYHDPAEGGNINDSTTVERQKRAVQTQSALKNRFQGAIDRMVWEIGASTAGSTPSKQGLKKSKRAKRSSAGSHSALPSPTPLFSLDGSDRKREKEEDNLSLTVWLTGSSSSSSSSTNHSSSKQRKQELTEFQLVLPSRMRTRMVYIYKLCARQLGISSSGDLLLCYSDHEGQFVRAPRRGYFDWGTIQRGEARLVCTYHPRPVTIRIGSIHPAAKVAVVSDSSIASSSCTTTTTSTTTTLFALERSSTVQHLYQAYGHANGMPLGSFELYYQGRKLLERYTPRSLQWFDHIEVKCHSLMGNLGTGRTAETKNDDNDDDHTNDDMTATSRLALEDPSSLAISSSNAAFTTPHDDEKRLYCRAHPVTTHTPLPSTVVVGVKGTDLTLVLEEESTHDPCSPFMERQ
jgi:hypothetical protein